MDDLKFINLYFFRIQWAVQRKALILSSLSTHIHITLSLKLQEIWLEFFQGFIQVLSCEAVTRHFDYYAVHARLNHLMEEFGLVALPEVCKGE
jgi:hypothetical protein